MLHRYRECFIRGMTLGADPYVATCHGVCIGNYGIA